MLNLNKSVAVVLSIATISVALGEPMITKAVELENLPMAAEPRYTDYSSIVSGVDYSIQGTTFTVFVTTQGRQYREIVDYNNSAYWIYSGHSASDKTRLLQTCLNKILNCGLTIDGSYGPATQRAVLQFQNSYGPLPADGSVGPGTWQKIHEQLRNRFY